MTNQEIFNTVCEHLAQQKRRAFDVERSVCLYRTSDGLKCAFGCLIPDEYFEAEFNSYPSITVLRTSSRIRAMFSKDQDTLISDLQGAHDQSGSIEELRYNLEHVVVNHNLDGASIDLIKEWAS